MKGSPNTPSRRLRGMALGLAEDHLTGRRRADAMAWIREPNRRASDLHQFIERLVAAHQPKAEVSR